MKKITNILVILFFAACQAEPEGFEEATPLLHTRASEMQFAHANKLNLTDIGIVAPSKIVRYDSLYVILTPKSNYRFAIYDLRTGGLKHLVPAGIGENEGLYYLNLHRTGSVVSSLDFGTGRLVEIDLAQYATPGYTPKFTKLNGNDKTPLGAIRCGDRIISTGIYTQGRYCCSNTGNDSDTYSVAYPACADQSMSDSLKSIFYASNSLVSHPDGRRIACANMQYGCLDICDFDGENLARVNEVHLTRANIRVHHKRPHGRGMWHPIAYTERNIFGFCDLTVSDEYIFALYSGRTYRQYKGDVDKGRDIFIFDWNGTHVRTLHIPNSCSSLSYDSASNSLYALSHEGREAEIIALNL